MHVWNGEGSVCFGDSEGVLQNHIRKVVDKNKHFLHSGCRLDRKSFRTGQLAKGCCVTQLLWAQMETIEYEMRARVGWPLVKGCTSCWRWVCTYIELSLGHFSTSSLKNSNSSKKPLENLFRCWWCYISILRSETQIEHTDQILGGKNVRTGLGTERSEIKKTFSKTLSESNSSRHWKSEGDCTKLNSEGG